jgi:hypothetical protein
MSRLLSIPVSLLLAVPFGACADAEPDVEPGAALDEDYGKPLYGVDDSGAAKADSFDGVAGPKVAGLSASTEVWKVTRRWYETDAAAGLAWPANSPLTWDQKFSAWVDALPALGDGYGKTFELTTPWGRTLASPRLECAETAMFLRATFASWYGLPFYMTAWNPQAGQMHFGHFGIVDSNGTRVSGFPRFANDYKDFTATMAGKTSAQILAAWPKDTNLRGRALTAQKDDDNSAVLGAGAYAGAYFDEIFLNKRVGHFMLRLLTYFGSMHIASTQNTFNLRPDAIRPGDPLVERWQKQGIGHVLVTKEVTRTQAGKLAVEAMFGSMPRIQPMWYDANLSKPYYTSAYTGGPGVNVDGDKYAALGGGLKRWRTPVSKNGRWYNIVPAADRASFIDGADLVAVAARPAQFETLMGELSADEQRDVLLQRIEVARTALRSRPASCSNRTRREEAFEELYTLMEDEFGMGAAEVDEAYRILDDYVLPELEYNQSKTCCWNSTTPDMYLVVMQLNEARVSVAQCVEPVVFKNDNGYKVFADYAASIGMASAWKAWSEDEPCAQRNVLTDTETEHLQAPFCSVRDAVLGND